MQRIHLEKDLPEASGIVRQNQFPNFGKPLYKDNNENGQHGTDQCGNKSYARRDLIGSHLQSIHGLRDEEDTIRSEIEKHPVSQNSIQDTKYGQQKGHRTNERKHGATIYWLCR